MRFFTERDGLKIAGHMYGEIRDHAPAVILCHGFMTDSSMCKGYAKLIADLGFLTFTFDFCGGSVINRSGGRTVDMSVFTELEDLKAVYAYVSKLPYVNQQKISLFGCSQGGFVSAMAAKQMNEETASLVLLYPALCIPDDARKGHMMFAKFDPQNIPEIIPCGPMKLGRNYVSDVIGIDPYEQIRGYKGPVLLLQGTGDRIVHPEYAQKAAGEYPHCEYHEIEGAGHMFRGKYDRIARAYIRDFYIRMLIGGNYERQ